MTAKTFTAALLAAALAAPAYAQDRTDALAAELAAMRARIAELETQVAALKARPVEAAPAQVATAAPAPAPAAAPAAENPAWKGAPQFTGKNGFSFKPKGLLQFDAGYVGTPGPERTGTVGGLNYNNLGWNSRARRLIVGAEGTLPGGFGYKAEFNFAQAAVDYEDIVLTWQGEGSPLQLTLGNFYPYSSLETVTSSRFTSFLERASLTDAFSYNRRLGVGVSLTDAKNDLYTLSAGLFGQEINNASFNRTGWQASARATYSPKLGDTRLHLGGNVQHRVAQRDAQNVQYRARPLTQVTDQRFADTGAIPADGDDIAGVELGAIRGPLHFAAEAQRVWTRGARAGDLAFGSAYAEVGFYLTGESRGYKNGRWDRTKVLSPFDKGGWGALQLNLRADYLDLSGRVNGGRQLGTLASLIWNPTDYLRFVAQYGRAGYRGGPRAATVVPGSAEPLDERSFAVDTVALRAQVDF